MRKNFLRILLLIITVTNFSLSKVFAEDTTTTDTSSGDYTLETEIDENTTVATNKYFDLTLTKGLQSPLNKSIIYTITIVPHIDSSKTQILWDSASSIKITPKHDEFVSMTSEQEYEYRAIIKPSLSGAYNISVSVISWQYDTNYTNTVTDTLSLSSSLVALPITPEYTISVVLVVLLVLAIIGLGIWGSSKLYKVVIKKAQNWLTPPR